MAINDKNLKSEIETIFVHVKLAGWVRSTIRISRVRLKRYLGVHHPQIAQYLSITRLSRMRLKHPPARHGASCSSSLNNKTLKNEIETNLTATVEFEQGELSITRLSRMRLKLERIGRIRFIKTALNNKTLKCEIETIKKGQAQGLPLQYVHDKHLRDEIETILPFSCVKCYLFRFSNLLPLFSFAHVKNECNRNQGRLWIGLSSPTVTR